uniref:Uncharacterized protein n=1 Tax=Meloidogyne incognita TaxID=6306 RepID=A0A914NK02_MELIC
LQEFWLLRGCFVLVLERSIVCRQILYQENEEEWRLFFQLFKRRMKKNGASSYFIYVEKNAVKKSSN